MGAEKKDDPEALSFEAPSFTCGLLTGKLYRISRYPITVAQFRAFVDDGGYTNDDYWKDNPAGLAWRRQNNITGPEVYGTPFETDNHPQVGVSWYEAMAFCQWFSAKKGMAVSLPTEAQWERAARGTRGRKYPWGDEFESFKCNSDESGVGAASAVGIFPAGAADENGEAIHDLTGNVWEWCRTKWRENYQDYERKVDDTLEGDERRVVRGGAFDFSRRGVRAADRLNSPPDLRDDFIGFRVVSPASER